MHKSILLCVILTICVCRTKQKIAEIGEEIITDQHLAYAINIERAYGNTNPDTISVIAVLIQQRLYKKVARKEGIIITDSMLEGEATRFDKETREPAILKEVKLVFGKNKHDFLEYFVCPVLAQRFLEEKYFFDTLLHFNEYNKIKESFKRVKQELLITDTTIRVFKPQEKLGVYYAKALNKGICEDKYSYYFARREDGDLKIYLITKDDFVEWFEKQALAIRVKIYDSKVKLKLDRRTENSSFWQELLGNR